MCVVECDGNCVMYEMTLDESDDTTKCFSDQKTKGRVAVKFKIGGDSLFLSQVFEVLAPTALAHSV